MFRHEREHLLIDAHERGIDGRQLGIHRDGHGVGSGVGCGGWPLAEDARREQPLTARLKATAIAVIHFMSGLSFFGSMTVKNFWLAGDAA